MTRVYGAAMEQIFDLPAHPLFVHAPLILVPLVALFGIVVLARPAWRARLGTWLLGVSVVVGVAFILAFQSGEAFGDLMKSNPNADINYSHHESLAETTRLFLFGMVLVLAVMVVFDRLARRRDDAAARQMVTGARLANVAAVVLGVLATIWIVRTGHEGAKLVWDGTVK